MFSSLMLDLWVTLEDAFQHPWDSLGVYAFPPFSLILQMISHVLITLGLTGHSSSSFARAEWLPNLLSLLVKAPRDSLVAHSPPYSKASLSSIVSPATCFGVIQ